MARYIDANELQKRLTKIADEPDYLHENETWNTGICLAGTQVDLMPTADVVEVVRCKDCKHWTGKEYVGCCQLSKIVARHADDFCSYGGRKDKE